MKNTDIQRLCEIFNDTEQYLEQYTAIAEVIMKIDSEESQLLTEKIAERQKLIDKISVLREEATQILDGSDKREAELIRGMLTGGTINEHIAEELIPVRNAIVNLRSAQIKAAETDRALQLQFESRLQEAKDQLKQLNDDKKKLDYYSSLKRGGAKLGGSLDGSF